MGKKRRTIIIAVLVAVAVLVIIAAVTWPWWRWWLPSAAVVRAWQGYLWTVLGLDQWSPLVVLFLLGVVEVVIALLLHRRSGAFERHVERLEREHARQVEVLEQQIALLQEEQQAFRAEMELREDLIRELKDDLWLRFDRAQQAAGLPVAHPISRIGPELEPEERGDLRRLIGQIERVEAVASASMHWDRLASRSRLTPDELIRMGGACYYLGQLERALTHYNKAVSLGSTGSDVLVSRAIVACALGQHANALQDLERALKNGEDARLYLYRGMCHEHLGEDKRAVEDYARAIRLDAACVEAYHRRGLVFARQGEHGRALQDQSRALELSPEHAAAYTARGVARAALGDPGAALGDLDRACLLAPESADCFYQRGLVSCRLGMYGEALANLSRALERAPDLAPAYLARAGAYLAIDEQEQAMADYDRAAELDPRSAAVYNARGEARAAARDYRGAIKDFERALDIDPSLALALANRGSAYEQLGDYDQAIRDLDRALVLSPGLASAYYSRGMAYGSKGEYDKASRDLNKAVELDPSLGKRQASSQASAA
jgi:tetratricopeptide (TPR) repeat protein